jgi:hypothetical protein
MESVSLDTLREAISNYETAIRFPDEFECVKKLS